MSGFRRILPLVAAVLVASTARGADLEIVRVFTRWHDAASFRGISEYLGGKEQTGGITMLRSQPAERAGFYWLMRLKNRGAALAGAKIELDVITPAAPTAQTFIFPVALPTGSTVFDVGVTGADWLKARAEPAAWRLRILDAQGRELAVEKSFLWEMPGKS